MSRKQTNKIFGSNRNKPKLILFRFIFDLFRETKFFGSFWCLNLYPKYCTTVFSVYFGSVFSVSV
jgi:hypothetical protein